LVSVFASVETGVFTVLTTCNSSSFHGCIASFIGQRDLLSNNRGRQLRVTISRGKPTTRRLRFIQLNVTKIVSKLDRALTLRIIGAAESDYGLGFALNLA
jgi:hypothetical protein